MTDLVTARDHILIFASAIESDLRHIIAEEVTKAGVRQYLTEDARLAALKRASRDDNCPKSALAADETLLAYLDLGQLCQLIQHHKQTLFAEATSGLCDVAGDAIRLIPCRNRAIHGRALEYDDFATIQQFVEVALRENKIKWTELSGALTRLRARAGGLPAIHIPSHWSDDDEVTPNNLPVADFADTGWIGRKRDVDNVRRLLKGSYPVISIVGEGGVGKSSLALKIAYEILEQDVTDDGPSFDLIVWLSLKSAVFSASGIRRIADSISDATALFARLADRLGVIETTDSDSELTAVIHRYLSEFKTLLILDNLEAIASERVRELLSNIPVGTKVLITTRVALGQSELSYPLAPLDERESAHLFRAYAAALNFDQLKKINSETIRGYCNRMSNNPLAIKWFVGSVANGKDPNVLITRHSASYRQLLEFAFSDLYGSFDALSTTIITVVFSAGKELTRAEILWLLELRGVDLHNVNVESHLRILIMSSVLRYRTEKGGDQQQRFELGAFAKQYIAEIARPGPDFIRQIAADLAKMRAASAEGDRALNYDRWDYKNAVDANTPEERVVRGRLLQAISVFRERIDQATKIHTAMRILEAAEKLMPAYSETMRIRAQTLLLQGDYWGAREEFERCLDVSPTSRLGRYAFAHSLIHRFEDYEHAIKICRCLVEEFPGDTPPKGLYALALQRNGQLLESVEVFESIVEHIINNSAGADSHVRARLNIIHLNQAAETYRRLAELDARAKNTRAFCEHISRAIMLSGLAFGQSGGYGEDHRKQQLKNLDEGLRVAWALRDPNIAVVVCDSFLRTDSRLNLSTLQVTQEMLLSLCSAGACLDFSKYLESEKFRLEGISADGFKQGTVLRVFPDKRFGFIASASGEELYFNFHDISPALRARVPKPGDAVHYLLGNNAQGVCARNVNEV